MSTPTPSSRSPRLPLAAAGIAALALMGGVTWFVVGTADDDAAVAGRSEVATTAVDPTDAADDPTDAAESPARVSVAEAEKGDRLKRPICRFGIGDALDSRVSELSSLPEAIIVTRVKGEQRLVVRSQTNRWLVVDDECYVVRVTKRPRR